MPVYTPPAWPAAVADTPATAVIDRAIADDRLSHSLLLHCEDLATLGAVAHAIAERLLNTPDARAHFPPDQHPDCFSLRPAGKMRQISAEATRQLIAKVQVSSTVSPRKVAIIHEADRMHVTAANVFLKTLEEPPPHTTLLLLTARPYALLPTIRSRVLLFRFAAPAEPVQAEGWSAWLVDYHALLGRLVTSAPERRAAADFEALAIRVRQRREAIFRGGVGRIAVEHDGLRDAEPVVRRGRSPMRGGRGARRQQAGDEREGGDDAGRRTPAGHRGPSHRGLDHQELPFHLV